MNERPIAITCDTDIASLYPDFVFKERTVFGLSCNNGIAYLVFVMLLCITKFVNVKLNIYFVFIPTLM